MHVLTRKSALRQAVLVLFAAFSCLGIASAGDLCPTGPFLVLNLTGDEEVANKAIAIAQDEEDLRRLIESYTADRTRPKKADDDAFFAELRDHLLSSNNRWITHRGEKIAVYVVYDRKTQKEPDLEIKDTPRKSRFALDLESLAKLAKAIRAAPTEVAEGEEIDSTIFVVRRCWLLTNVRSTLEATATAEPLEPSQPSAVAKASATLTTGPTEHAFLSADLPVNDAEELKLESGQLVSKETPSTFYVGLDYMLGDVLAEKNTLAQGLTIKALVKASREPLESIGIALGLRFKSINALGFQLDTFSPFVGYIWNKNDTADGGNEYKGDWRFGISLNLDNALAWVQSNSD